MVQHTANYRHFHRDDHRKVEHHTPRESFGINQPLPPKVVDAAPAVPSHPPVDLEAAFRSYHFRSKCYTIAFATEEGLPIAQKSSDGFVTLKPRGGSAETRHFVLIKDDESVSLNKKQVRQDLEAHFSKSHDYKLAQLHLNLK